jgi:DNA phosphorothioation-dependent restriction protein DptH
MKSLEKRPYIGDAPQLRFIDSMLLVDEADNIMKCNFEVLRQNLLQGREFGVGALLASQYLSHFKTREMDYTEPLLTWFIHKVPNVTARELEAIGLTGVGTSLVERVKTHEVHHCLLRPLTSRDG